MDYTKERYLKKISAVRAKILRKTYESWVLQNEKKPIKQVGTIAALEQEIPHLILKKMSIKSQMRRDFP